MEMLAGKIAPGGTLHIATDFEGYALEILEVLQADARFSNPHADLGYRQERESIPKTKYEKAILDAGRKIYYFEFSKEPDYVLAPTA